MRPDESTYPADWKRIADKDLVRAERMVEADDPDAAGYFFNRHWRNTSRHFFFQKDGG